MTSLHKVKGLIDQIINNVNLPVFIAQKSSPNNLYNISRNGESFSPKWLNADNISLSYEIREREIVIFVDEVKEAV